MEKIGLDDEAEQAKLTANDLNIFRITFLDRHTKLRYSLLDAESAAKLALEYEDIRHWLKENQGQIDRIQAREKERDLLYDRTSKFIELGNTIMSDDMDKDLLSRMILTSAIESLPDDIRIVVALNSEDPKKSTSPETLSVQMLRFPKEYSSKLPKDRILIETISPKEINQLSKILRDRYQPDKAAPLPSLIDTFQCQFKREEKSDSLLRRVKSLRYKAWPTTHRPATDYSLGRGFDR